MDIITLEQAAELLLAALAAIAAGGLLSAPITTFLVSVIKRIPQLASTPASGIQFWTGLALTVVVWLAQALNLGVQVQSLFEAIVVIGPAILSLLTTLTASNALYQVARRNQVGVLGYTRGLG